MEFNFTKNEQVKSWLQSRIDLVNPDKVVYIDGSEELYKKLTDEAIASGEMIKLNENGFIPVEVVPMHTIIIQISYSLNLAEAYNSPYHQYNLLNLMQNIFDLAQHILRYSSTASFIQSSKFSSLISGLTKG